MQERKRGTSLFFFLFVAVDYGFFFLFLIKFHFNCETSQAFQGRCFEFQTTPLWENVIRYTNFRLNWNECEQFTIYNSKHNFTLSHLDHKMRASLNLHTRQCTLSIGFICCWCFFFFFFSRSKFKFNKFEMFWVFVEFGTFHVRHIL